MADDELRAYSRDAFVANECESDEYRETQPEKGLSFLQSYLDDGGEHDAQKRAHVIDLAAKWLAVIADRMNNARHYQVWEVSYAGSEELKPILEIIHDWYWGQGSHPYGADYRTDALVENYKEDHA